MTEDFFTDLLLILEFSNHADSDSEPSLSALPEMVLRCLINMMNGNILASDLFLEGTVNGLKKVLSLLQVLGTNNRYSAMMHLGTKLLYMLLSQRYELISFPAVFRFHMTDHSFGIFLCIVRMLV